MSGPDEPTDELRPVDVTLDGTGADLENCDTDAKLDLGDVQEMLDRIEERVSRVLGVPGAPDSFDDKDDTRAFELLITLARIGTELGTLLRPLEIGKGSINVIVNESTRVLPLELVYAGPHRSTTPRSATTSRTLRCRTGLRQSVAAIGVPVCVLGAAPLDRAHRQGQGRNTAAQPWTSTISASSVLYGATVIADDGASDPLPTASVLAAAQSRFAKVIRVTSWTAWRKAVKRDAPNLLVVLGHLEGGGTNLYIGEKSVLARWAITTSELHANGHPASACAPHRVRVRRDGRCVRVTAGHADREGRGGRA